MSLYQHIFNNDGKSEVKLPMITIRIVDKDPTVFKTPNHTTYNHNISSQIGTNIRQVDGLTIYDIISLYINKCQLKSSGIIPPFQMFLRSPQSGISEITNSNFLLIDQLIKSYNLHYYTHSSFIINLSNPFTKKNPLSDAWIMSLLTNDLVDTRKIGGRGVVVHVGKYCKMDPNIALDKMEYYIRQSLKYATEECPLLLETAAGQGTELCVKFEELSNFYDRFDRDEKMKFKICVDTCHVFAAGYDPMKFLKTWYRDHPDSIQLVHFNDSLYQIGMKKDRHSPYLKGGYIGFRKLMKVAQWCLDHSIDMVTE